MADRDYPATWQAFERWFPDEASCIEFLAQVRWRCGFVCPVCGQDRAWRIEGGLWMCQQCGRKTSATAGTIFHRSHLPLRSWFAAMWFVCAQKKRVSALGLQRVLGFGSYRTAWTWMHKLRRAMVRPDRELLGGEDRIVEMDSTFIGGRTSGRAGPRYYNKEVVVIAVERVRPRGLGRVRLTSVGDRGRKTATLAFATAIVAPGTILYTDGDNLYDDLPAGLSITHVPHVLVHAAEPADQLLPGVHRVASLLKRWLAGTLQNGMSHTQLAYYLDEFTFRFNRRSSRSRGLLWYRLVEQAVATDPHPYADLIAEPRIKM